MVTIAESHAVDGVALQHAMIGTENEHLAAAASNAAGKERRMSLPIFTSDTRNDKLQWKQLGKMLSVSVGIVAIAVAGGVLGHLAGSPKAFFLIVATMAIWFVTGWFMGGWRAVLAGLSALTAALAASDGTYPLALIFCSLAFVVSFVQIPSVK